MATSNLRLPYCLSKGNLIQSEGSDSTALAEQGLCTLVRKRGTVLVLLISGMEYLRAGCVSLHGGHGHSFRWITREVR